MRSLSVGVRRKTELLTVRLSNTDAAWRHSGRRVLRLCHAKWVSGLVWVSMLCMTGALNIVVAGDCPADLPVWNVQVNGQMLVLEVAESLEARQCGLSGRSSLAADGGMLFVLPRTMPVAFWMEDTALALSIAFLDEHGRIVDIQTMTPERTDVLYRSPGPVRYVVEVNRNWFGDHAVKVGDRVQMPGLSSEQEGR